MVNCGFLFQVLAKVLARQCRYTFQFQSTFRMFIKKEITVYWKDKSASLEGKWRFMFNYISIEIQSEEDRPISDKAIN